jgi:hypothetical protein
MNKATRALLVLTIATIAAVGLSACTSGLVASGKRSAAPSATASEPVTSTRNAGITSNTSNTSSTSSTSSTSRSTSSTGTTVTISGGLETVAGDHGRPIVLVAGLLGVPPAVFRQAFSGVTPADPALGPSTEEAQRNKAALLAVLGPYGITNAELDTASNTYRYNAAAGQTWPHTAATATAIVVNGKVTGITITNAGAGYTSAPTITLSTGQIATATLAYGKDAATNGSIATITLN